MPQSRTLKAATLGSGQFLVKVTTLVTAAILSRLFTQTDYAAYRQTLLAYFFVAPLLMLGLPRALYYFIPRDKENARSILTGNLLLLLLMGLGFMVAMWCGGNELLAKRFSNPALRRLLLIYSPFAVLALPVTAIGACLVSCDRVKTLTIYNVVSRVVIFACIMGFVLLWRQPEAAISGVVVGELIVFLPAIMLMYRATGGQDWRPSKANIWEQLKYSLPLGLAGMVGIICMNLDKVLVSSFCPPTDFAVYVNGAIEIPLIGVITGSVMAILIPEFAIMYQHGQHEQILPLWHRAMAKCAMLIFPIMAFLFIMAPHVIKVLFSAKYAASAIPFRIYLLLLPVRITQFGAILMASGKSSWILIRTIIELLLNGILSVILIHKIGYLGAAIATVVIVYTWAIPFNLAAILGLCKSSLAKLLPYKALMKIAVVALLAGVVGALTNKWLPVSTGDVARLAVVSPIFLVALSTLMLVTGLVKISALKGILRRAGF
jgi:O-antigen/teichoic acid export membrane protein